MSIDKAKEFLLDVAEDESAAAKVQTRYLESLVEVSRELGYELTTDDISMAIEQMSGLDEPEEDEVEGLLFSPGGRLHLDSLTWVKAPTLGVVSNPLGLGIPRRPGGPPQRGR